jgi:hypothetical protein
VIFDMVAINVVVLYDDAFAPEGGVSNVAVYIFELAVGIGSTDEMGIGQSEDFGQRGAVDCPNLYLLPLRCG